MSDLENSPHNASPDAEFAKAPCFLSQIEQSLTEAASQLARIESYPISLGIYPKDWREQLAMTEEMISQQLDELQNRMTDGDSQPELKVIG